MIWNNKIFVNEDDLKSWIRFYNKKNDPKRVICILFAYT